MYSEHGTAGEPGAVVGISGWWRVYDGLRIPPNTRYQVAAIIVVAGTGDLHNKTILK